MAQFAHIAFTNAVKKIQNLMNTRVRMQRLADHPNKRDRLTDEQMEFLRARKSLYIATASAAGMPYIQHRGGDAGFVRVISPTTLMITEQPGNGQFITQGNLSENPSAMLFVMDYANRRRLKLWGEAFVDYDDSQPALIFKLKAWDENCPQFIPQLFEQ